LGEGPHTNEQGHAFPLALIRHPRFVDTVNDVVVESGSARYQEGVDSFVRGGNVSDDALREVFENTAGAAPVWDRPIYADFFRAIRDLNRRLPPERQLRILLAILQSTGQRCAPATTIVDGCGSGIPIPPKASAARWTSRTATCSNRLQLSMRSSCCGDSTRCVIDEPAHDLPITIF
jgi:hypothetical protein